MGNYSFAENLKDLPMRSISQCERFPGGNSEEFPGVKDFLAWEEIPGGKDSCFPDGKEFPV